VGAVVTAEESPGVSVVYVTTGTREEALRIGRALVEERLAACANVLGEATSVYRWQGATEEAAEVLLLLKSRTDLVEAVVARVAELHSYDCPCVTSWPVTAGYGEYLDWIVGQTR
jgi:periplasmic divalent cation tolerance protein